MKARTWGIAAVLMAWGVMAPFTRKVSGQPMALDPWEVAEFTRQFNEALGYCDFEWIAGVFLPGAVVIEEIKGMRPVRVRLDDWLEHASKTCTVSILPPTFAAGGSRQFSVSVAGHRATVQIRFQGRLTTPPLTSADFKWHQASGATLSLIRHEGTIRIEEFRGFWEAVEEEATE